MLPWLKLAPLWPWLCQSRILISRFSSSSCMCGCACVCDSWGWGGGVVVSFIRLSSNWWPAKRVHWLGLHMDNWPVASQSTLRMCYVMLASWTNEHCGVLRELKIFCQFSCLFYVYLQKSFVCLSFSFAPEKKNRNPPLEIITLHHTSLASINLLNCLSVICYHPLSSLIVILCNFGPLSLPSS